MAAVSGRARPERAVFSAGCSKRLKNTALTLLAASVNRRTRRAQNRPQACNTRQIKDAPHPSTPEFHQCYQASFTRCSTALRQANVRRLACSTHCLWHYAHTTSPPFAGLHAFGRLVHPACSPLTVRAPSRPPGATAPCHLGEAGVRARRRGPQSSLVRRTPPPRPPPTAVDRAEGSHAPPHVRPLRDEFGQRRFMRAPRRALVTKRAARRQAPEASQKLGFEDRRGSQG